MADQQANTVIDIKPSIIAAWFHRLFTVPVVEIDGSPSEVTSWGRTPVTASPGRHRINVHFRYRGRKAALLGRSTSEFEVAAGETTRIEARLGPRNGSVFRILTSSARPVGQERAES